jgi:hypothetical protein
LTSQKQIDANQRNALKSTGPRTAPGKQQSRRNAQVHGILSTALIAAAGEHSDDATQYTKQLEALRERCQPADAVEDLLVERLALASVQMASAVRAEFGGGRADRTALAAERHAWRAQGVIELVADIRAEHPPDLAPHDAAVVNECRAVAATALRTTSAGIAWLLRTLDQRVGELLTQPSDNAVEELVVLFGRDDTELGTWLRTCERATTEGTTAPSAMPVERLEIMAHEQRAALAAIAAECAREEAAEIEAMITVPSSEELDRILRYSKTVHNAFLRDLQELERVQALRRERAALPIPVSNGHSVPPRVLALPEEV